MKSDLKYLKHLIYFIIIFCVTIFISSNIGYLLGGTDRKFAILISLLAIINTTIIYSVILILRAIRK